MSTIEEIKEATEAEQALPEKKRGRGRPRKVDIEAEKNRVTKETRVPLGGFRNILTVENKDPNYHYFWAIDETEGGTAIARAQQAGYEFVRPEEGVVVGEASVFKTENVGSIIRVPAGGGMFHYLMKMPMAFYEDDQRRHNERVDQTESALKNQGKNNPGFYGGVNITR